MNARSEPLSHRRTNLAAGAHARDWPARLTQFAFLLALAIVFARATMLESVRDSLDVDYGADTVPRGPGPAAGLVLDLVSCLPALLVLLRRLIDPAYVLRFAWSHLAFALFAGCAVLSSIWSADRFLALVTGAHVVAAAALLWSMTQLVRTWLRLRLVAGVCFGLLLACLAHGLIYRFVDLPDMRRSWERERETILKQRGWEPDSFTARQFERKILGGEMIGFHVSPNAFAAVLVMLTVVSAGVTIQRFVHRDEAAWAAAIILALAVSIAVMRWTNSKTAMATLVWAAGAFGILALARPWLIRHARKTYWICLIAIVLDIAAVGAHGSYHGGLFEGRFSNSLHFRWRYWVGAARVFETHPLLGVGWSNFGNFYLAHRLPEASEEVRDPHNVLVRAFVELGIVGGVLLIAWLARMAWELTRPIVPSAPAEEESQRPHDPQLSLGRTIMAMALVSGLAFVINVAASIDFAESLDYVFVEICKRLLYVCLLFAGGLIVVVRSTKRQELDARPAPWILYGCLIGMGTMLLQNLIDLSLFEAGPMMIFAMLTGAAGGVRAPPAQGKRTRPVLAAATLAGATVAWAAALLFVAAPVVSAQIDAYEADIDIRYGRTLSAAGRFSSAFHQAPTNADYTFRAARALIMERATPADVRALLDRTIAADPTLIKAYLMRAAYEMQQSPPDAQAVRAHYDRALALNPADIDTRLRYAADLDHLNLKPEAAEQYRKALEFNDLLPIEEPERLAREKVEEIEKRIS